MQSTHILEAVSEQVWRTRYCWLEPGRVPEPSIEASWDRVALAVSGAETHHRDEWRERFRTILHDFRFLPGGRILAGAGTARHTTLFNCFVAGPLEDSVQGIFNALREAMVTLQAGGGVGVDFSTLRPAGAQALASAGVASGPVSFMNVWEAANAVLALHNVRRGALMATLRCDHPDIEAFIDAKVAGAVLPHFKLSVAISNDFMHAVAQDGPWPLLFPLGQHPVPVGAEVCERVWSGNAAPQLCQVHRRVPARLIWDKLLAAQLACTEPDVLFIDRINRDNNLWYREQLATTSPCGEVPLPPYGGCNLGSINLTRFVQDSVTGHPSVDWVGLKAVAGIATRFLDDVHDISLLPLKAQEKTVRASRRIGLGVTGLADMLAMLGLRYGSEASLDLARAIMGTIRDTAYSTSIEISKEKGAFPEFDKIKYGASPFVLGLSHQLQDAIAAHGMRNSHLLAVAPASTISLLANKVSSGIDALAADISADEQLRMMSVVQSCVDSAVSKTVRLPRGTQPQELELVLLQAWELGLKGCAVYCGGSASA